MDSEARRVFLNSSYVRNIDPDIRGLRVGPSSVIHMLEDDICVAPVNGQIWLNKGRVLIGDWDPTSKMPDIIVQRDVVVVWFCSTNLGLCQEVARNLEERIGSQFLAGVLKEPDGRKEMSYCVYTRDVQVASNSYFQNMCRDPWGRFLEVYGFDYNTEDDIYVQYNLELRDSGPDLMRYIFEAGAASLVWDELPRIGSVTFPFRMEGCNGITWVQCEDGSVDVKPVRPGSLLRELKPFWGNYDCLVAFALKTLALLADGALDAEEYGYGLSERYHTGLVAVKTPE